MESFITQQNMADCIIFIPNHRVSGIPGFNPRLSYTKDSKNGT